MSHFIQGSSTKIQTPNSSTNQCQLRHNCASKSKPTKIAKACSWSLCNLCPTHHPTNQKQGKGNYSSGQQEPLMLFPMNQKSARMTKTPISSPPQARNSTSGFLTLLKARKSHPSGSFSNFNIVLQAKEKA